jgi:hypothetical protein
MSDLERAKARLRRALDSADAKHGETCPELRAAFEALPDRRLYRGLAVEMRLAIDHALALEGVKLPDR